MFKDLKGVLNGMKEAEIELLQGWNAIQKGLVVSQLLF